MLGCEWGLGMVGVKGVMEYRCWGSRCGEVKGWGLWDRGIAELKGSDGV